MNKVFNFLLLYLKKIYIKEILVLGDSHAAVFSHETISSSFPNYIFNIISVPGATVSGLENPNSKTQAFQIFADNIKLSKAKITIVLLGEVDTGFVIWYRSEKYKTSVSEMLEKALENYQNLLLLLKKTSRVICISTPLPTIKDGQVWGEIANARREIKATQLQRTELTIKFNNLMKSFCSGNKITYLSLDEDSIGENGLVRNGLLNSNPASHHYSKHFYAEMIIKKLEKVIK